VARRDRPDRRHDRLFRALVEQCRVALLNEGYRLTSRGSSEESAWVEFLVQPVWAPGATYTLVLRVMHRRPAHLVRAEMFRLEHTGSVQSTGYSLAQYYPPTILAPREEAVRLAAQVSEWAHEFSERRP